MGATEAATVTVYSDYVCPFCYLGRASLTAYRESRERPLAVEWHPFDLRADQRGPDGELDGDPPGKDDAYFAEVRENVRRLAGEYGVEMTTAVARDVDSLPAQAASLHVRETAPERWAAFDGAVFEALWTAGRDVGDAEVLAELATDVGVDPGGVRAAVDDEALRDRLFEQFRAAREAGVTGVPTFAYDGHAARGAVPPAQLRRLVEGT